ncbi:LRR receptor-like serine/threonine-protein kinase GSO1 [Bienertia sinuspersici]
MNKLTGKIPEVFGQMNQLLSLVLSSNNLYGSIPPSICTTTLQSLYLSNAQLSVPKRLDLSNNTLNGSIPVELYQLAELTDLYLYNNSLSGSISPAIGNLSNLQTLALYYNKLSGSLPKEIGLLQGLEVIYIYNNQLSGEIPLEIGNCSSLQMIDFYGNQFTGSVPATIGLLKELNFLHLRQNDFVGDIPATLGNCQQLTILDLADNRLTGGIPATLGKLKALQQFMLYNNTLEGTIPDELKTLSNLTRVNLSNNKLNGSIAPLCSTTALLSFDVTNNAFDHEIPPQLGNSPLLERLRIGSNHFTGGFPEHSVSYANYPCWINHLTGRIPTWFGSLPQLGELKLSSNSFFGPLPPELFNCSKLLVLSLDDNQLNGTLPTEVGDLASLNVLKLSKNQISGSIPPSIGKLSKLYELQLSNNHLNAEIPVEISQLQNLQIMLDLSFNNLTGHIPPQIGSLSKLEGLSLSHNQLTGEVPSQIGAMSSLSMLNLSYNNLEGKVDRQLSRWPVDVFVGNKLLCGKPLEHCDASNGSNHKHSPGPLILSSFLTVVAAVVLLLGVVICIRRRRLMMKRSREVGSTFSTSSSNTNRRLLNPKSPRRQPEYRWDDIMVATKNLSDAFIIGSGGSGTIYKADLAYGETVAVKKIARKDDLLLDKSFAREIKTLGRIRHRHLVKLIGYCSNKGAGSNLLIYDYMENGSVWDWLHGQQSSINKAGVKRLDWETRLRIGVGLAQGVEYLHHDCVPKIIHRDIKSSNLLLDSNMDAHLGDFGLAKQLHSNYESINDTESSIWFAGSYGYIAPEYAYSLKATEKSDVYSMGIVLMELVTGKMPTDRNFGTDIDMVRWVETHIEMEGIEREKLIDPSLKPLSPNEECASFQVLEIALQCTKTYPAERPNSRQICDQLLQVYRSRTVNGSANKGDLLIV